MGSVFSRIPGTAIYFPLAPVTERFGMQYAQLNA
jgi:hypothetical protein